MCDEYDPGKSTYPATQLPYPPNRAKIPRYNSFPVYGSYCNCDIPNTPPFLFHALRIKADVESKNSKNSLSRAITSVMGSLRTCFYPHLPQYVRTQHPERLDLPSDRESSRSWRVLQVQYVLYQAKQKMAFMSRIHFTAPRNT